MTFSQNKVSIHAPARGATRGISNDKSIDEFQSTLPRGERRCAIRALVHKSSFNPRSREGSDCCVCHCLPHHLVSIHAPARGATTLWKMRINDSKFQSTLPRGERLFRISIVSFIFFVSIHAPARGATSDCYRFFYIT